MSNNETITYESLTLPIDMFPFAPGSEVVVRKEKDYKWFKAHFAYKLSTGYIVYVGCIGTPTRVSECHPLATHGHLLGTAYPADTPECTKCGKAQPDCVCEKDNEEVAKTDGVGETLKKYAALTAERDRLRAELDALKAKEAQAQPGELQPFQQVLVRDDENEIWCIEFFERHVSGDICPYICLVSAYERCIPYSGNEHLLGTTLAPKSEAKPIDADKDIP